MFKDLPDVKGDEGAGIRTLSVAFGQQFVFRACGALLTAAWHDGRISLLPLHFL